MSSWRRLVPCGFMATAAVLASAGCTPTARTPGPYAAKARATARAVHSAVASDVLVIEAVRRGHTTAAFVSVATSESEDAGSEAISTFSAIQPPDENSEQLRQDVSELLNFADDALSEARIAGRRGDTEALLASEDALQQVDEQLQHAAEGEAFDTDQLSSSSSSSESESSASQSSESGG